jgi:hypothetical protein
MTNLGLVISTFGTPEYIQLAMEVMKNNGVNIPVLVHDDSSGDKNLQEICRKYGCNFTSTRTKYGHFAGDVASVHNGLIWAENKKIDVLIKMSRRFIPLFDWTKSLLETIEKNPNFTYGNRCNHFDFPLRTECVAYVVKKWINNLGELKKVITKYANPPYRNLTTGGHIEFEMFNMAKSFGVWKEIGDNRMRKMPNILWHDYCNESNYENELKKFKPPLHPHIQLTTPSIPKWFS